MRTAIDSILSATWHPTQCEILTFHLDSGESHPLNDLDEFLKALPGDVIPAWCEILGSLETARARRRVIDALVRKAAGECGPFLPFLEDSRWYLVRNVALILGMIGDEMAIPALTKVLRHEDSRVRREALDALNEISPERTVGILARSFNDPDARVRTAAARNAALAGRKAVPHLLAVIKEKEFKKRELDEKRAFFEAFGYAGGSSAVSFLRDVLNRRSLLQRSQLDELRSCACDALGWTEADEAVDLLTIHLQDRSPLVQASARTGLTRIAAGQEREPFIREAA
jgi:HEAT repeat protein